MRHSELLPKKRKRYS